MEKRRKIILFIPPNTYLLSDPMTGLIEEPSNNPIYVWSDSSSFH